MTAGGADWDAIRKQVGEGEIDVRLATRDELVALFNHVPEEEIQDVVTRVVTETRHHRQDRETLVAVLKALARIGDVALRVAVV